MVVPFSAGGVDFFRAQLSRVSNYKKIIKIFHQNFFDAIFFAIFFLFKFSGILGVLQLRSSSTPAAADTDIPRVKVGLHKQKISAPLNNAFFVLYNVMQLASTLLNLSQLHNFAQLL